MVDAVDSKSTASDGVGVRVPPPAESTLKPLFGAFFIFTTFTPCINRLFIVPVDREGERL